MMASSRHLLRAPLPGSEGRTGLMLEEPARIEKLLAYALTWGRFYPLPGGPQTYKEAASHPVCAVFPPPFGSQTSGRGWIHAA